MIAIPPRRSPSPAGEPHEAALAETNRLLAMRCASRPACHFLQPALADAQGGLAPAYDDGDGIHLNAAGYRVLLQTLAEHLPPNTGRQP